MDQSENEFLASFSQNVNSDVNINIKKDNENVKSKHNKEEHFCDLFGHFTKNKNSCEYCAQIFMNIAKTL